MFKRRTAALALAFGITIFMPQAHADVPWPKTFIGQADFEFLRDEVIEEIKKTEKENADKYIAVLGDLMTEEMVDPFSPRTRMQTIGAGKYSKKNATTQKEDANKERTFRDVYPDIKIGEEIEVALANNETAKATLTSDDEATLVDSKNVIKITVNVDDEIVEYIEEVKEEKPNVDHLFAEKGKFSGSGGGTGNNTALNKYQFMSAELPQIDNMSDRERVDLTDFISFLENILIKATGLVESNLKDKDFTSSLKDVDLQSIVTSPFKYVVINNQRYGLGDNFKLAVNIKLSKTQNIEKLIKPYIPNEKKISKELYAEYVKLKDQAIAKYNERIGQNKSETNGDSHNIIVTIKSIEHRKVVLGIFGKDYPLELKLIF